MEKQLENLNTAVILLKNGKLLNLNAAALRVLGWDEDSLKRNIAKLSDLSPNLVNFEKLLSSLNNGDYDEELKNSTKHKRVELSIGGHYYNCYLSLVDGIYLIELTQIVYQDMKQTTHELKRPIQNIKTLIETLQMGAKNDKFKLDDYLLKLGFEADRLATMVQDLLSLSLISSGALDLTKSEIDLSARVEKLIASASSRANARSVKLINKISAGTKLLADQKLLDHLIGNLIDNAIKYNKENGEVIVAFDDNNLSIADTGLGIAQEDLEKVFDQFYRIADRIHIKGSGLGLSIVKTIVDLHDWEIEIESNLGEGTKFIVKS